ncbi:hypothetical protein ACFL9U_15405, partial [Thermodesulfobacteriota bacterium]
MNRNKVTGIFLLIVAFSLFFAAHAFGASLTWNNAGGDGSWHNSANWSPEQLPAAGDDVTIPAGETANYSTGTSDLNSFTVSGTLNITGGALNSSADSTVAEGGTIAFSAGTLGGSGSVTISGTFNWNGGSVSVTNGFFTTGTTTLSGTSDKILSNNSTWTNSGTVDWMSGDFNLSGTFAIFNNNGIFNIVTTYYKDYIESTGTFNNNSGGFLNKPGDGIITILSAAFTNAGTVDLDDGTLKFSGCNTTSMTGKYDIASPGILEFYNLTHNIETVSPVAAGSDGTLKITIATVNFNISDTSLPDTLTVNQTGGYISGTGSVTLEGAYDWSAGTVSITTGLTTAGTTTLSGTSDKLLSNNTTWTNTGTVDWMSSDLRLNGTLAIFNNNGIFNIVTIDGMDFIEGTGTFNNNSEAFLNKPNSGVISIRPTAFTNAGTVDVDDGTLNFYNCITTSMTGNYNITSPGILDLNTSTHNIGTASPVA